MSFVDDIGAIREVFEVQLLEGQTVNDNSRPRHCQSAIMSTEYEEAIVN